MEAQDAMQLLRATVSSDNELRNNAVAAIQKCIDTDFSNFLRVFSPLVTKTDAEYLIRSAASIVIRDSLHSHSPSLQKEIESRYIGVPEAIRDKIRAYFEDNLNWKEPYILSCISSIVGSLARMDYVFEFEADFFNRMKTAVENTEYAVGILSAVTAACQQLRFETNYNLNSHIVAIYTISTMYLKQGVSKAALFSTLECISTTVIIFLPHLRDVNIRNNFLLRLFDCQDFGTDVLSKALKCIVKCVDIAHLSLRKQIPGMCQYFNKFLAYDDNVKIEIFEFYSLIIKLEIEEAVREHINLILSHCFASLTKDEDEEWTLHKSAAGLLCDFRKMYRGEILKSSIAREFIAKKLQEDNSESIAIGCVAIGSISESGSSDFLYNVLNFILKRLDDEECQKEVLYGIAMIFESDPEITDSYAEFIYSKCVSIFESNTLNSETAVWTINSMFLGVNRRKSMPGLDYFVFREYENIIKYFSTKFATYASNMNMQIPLHNAFGNLVSISPPKHSETIIELIEFLYKIIEFYLSNILVSEPTTVLQIEKMLNNIVLLIGKAIPRVPNFDLKRFHQVMSDIMQERELSTRGEIYIIFSKHLDLLLPIVHDFIDYSLTDSATVDTFVGKAAINFLCDAASILEKRFVDYLDLVMTKLTNNIYSNYTSLEMKAYIVACFGDIAIAVGVYFEPHYPKILEMCSQISNIRREGNEEYVDDLRKNMLILIDSLIIAIGSTDVTTENLNYLISQVEYVISQDVDNAYIEESVTLVEDICRVFGVRLSNLDWCIELLKKYIKVDEDHAIRVKKFQEFG